MSVEIESSLTQLVFEHALRIRLKSEATEADKKDVTKKTNVTSEAKEKTGQIVGKINNLVTTDIHTINNTWTAMTLRT